MSQILLPLLPRLLAGLCMFLVGAGPSAGAPGAGGAFPLAPQAMTVQWLRLDSRQPRTLYAGLSDADYCDHDWRSTDAGATWSSLDAALVAALGGDTCSHPAPVVFSSDGKTVYLEVRSEPHGYPVLRSTNGTRWQLSGENDFAYATAGALAASVTDPTRVYVVRGDEQAPDQGGGCATSVSVSTDAGRTWARSGDPARGDAASTSNALLVDPVRPHTLYASIITCGTDDEMSNRLVRSDDDGHHWTGVRLPGSLTSLRVGVDPHERGAIVGHTTDKGAPASRAYLSRDGGRSWTAAACPGVRRGVCPTYTVDNAFGARRSYAFFPDGIYPFVDGSPAGRRLALSDQLPTRIGRIDAVLAGSRSGDPIYLLVAGGQGMGAGVIYRSTDAGMRWRSLPVALLGHR